MREFLYDTLGLSTVLQIKIFLTVVVLPILWLIRIVVLRIVWKRTSDVNIRYMWQKGSTYFTVVLSLIAISVIWFEVFGSLATFLGLVSAGLAIALKDIVANVAGWLFIISRRPFTLGDRIEIGTFRGDVVDIRIFMFTLLEIGNWVDADQSTGRLIHVPNGMVLQTPLVNFTGAFKFIWEEIPVLITFESNWKKAKQLLKTIVERHTLDVVDEARKWLVESAKRYLIRYKTLTPTVYTKVVESGVLLTLRYLVEPRRRRGIAEKIWEDILNTFEQHPDIDFAYPTIRYFDHTREGKAIDEKEGNEKGSSLTS